MMDWLFVLALVVVTPVWIVGALVMVYEWRDRKLPIPARPHPSYIFRLVKRDERAVYVRIMRRTFTVAIRDANRAMAKLGRAFGKALQPIMDFAASFGRRDG
jgi:hypothetical protein